MAASKFGKSVINWNDLAKRVPPTQMSNFTNFKSKWSDYMKRLHNIPENVPKIDWALYKKQVTTAGLVDSFQKSYEALKIPYPRAPDAIYKELDDQEKTIKIEIDVFKKESNCKIKEYKEELCILHSLIPYNQMTMEDFKDAHPDIAIDPINKPTFWPHDKAEQMDYTDKGHPLYGAKVQEH